MSSEIAIKVENLSKVYKLYNSALDRLKESLHPLRRHYHHEFYALNDISFDIKKGESVGIIGKNGSGKSTLLKILTGVLTPTSGSVIVSGKVSALLELGAGFNPELTGIENVYFNGMLMGFSREEMDEKLDKILSFADIGQFIQQPVKTYSSGMFVRLAFAVAVNVEPEILIIDEALSVGDMRFQRKCYAAIENFREQKNTILFVSHDVTAIGNICDNAILLDAGKFVSRDEPRIISKNYIQLIYNENLIEPAINKNSHYRDTVPDEFTSIRDCVINKIGLVSKASSCELRHGNGRAEVIDFGINDNNGSRVSRLISGSKYRLFFYLIFYEYVPDLFVSFVIRDSVGTNLFITNTDIVKLNIPAQQPGNVIQVCADIEMNLAAGEYFLSCVALDNSKSEYLDRRLDVYHFNVAPFDLHCKGHVNLKPHLSIENVIQEEIRGQFHAVGFHGDQYLISFVNSILCKCQYLIETGANVGSTLAFVAKSHPGLHCYSCEPDSKAYTQALENTSGLNVSLFNELSQDFLVRIGRELSWLYTKNVVFWLDAHGYGYRWPLREEICFITQNFINAFIFIDDFKVPEMECFGYDSYEDQECSYEYIKEYMSPIRNYNIYYPKYTDRTSEHHPLRGWCLIEYGYDNGVQIPAELKDKIHYVQIN